MSKRTGPLFCAAILSLILFPAPYFATAQEKAAAREYVTPKDSLVVKNLAHWQDLKFGLFMHWGTYSQWGVVESWSICPEDEGWTQRRGPYAATYNGYVSAYEQLQTTFNPTDFNPDKWATAARDAGMKYVVFTTKHHDGFCMFDTHQTDYRITSPKTPFSSNPKANVAKEVFDAFRKDSFLVGAYFSKADWHTDNYWWPYFPAKDRNPNYDPAKYPERWKAFKDFTFNQIEELSTGYGKLDILWLDGGWVRPVPGNDSVVDDRPSGNFNQDIDMPKIASMARTHQPGLIVVDRTVSGEYENYLTPEQTVPAEPLAYPWESCITMGNSWSYVPGDHYKSSNDLIHLLLRIVSRGGNLLLNIGPSPKGDFSDTAYSRLKDIGTWMHTHGDGIYSTKPLAPYGKGNVVYLQSKDAKTAWVYVLSDSGNSITSPTEIPLDGLSISTPRKVTCIDAPGKKIRYISGPSPKLVVPGNITGKYAIAYKLTL